MAWLQIPLIMGFVLNSLSLSQGNSSHSYIYGKTQKELLEKLQQNRDLYRDVELTEASRMTPREWLDKSWRNTPPFRSQRQSSQ